MKKVICVLVLCMLFVFPAAAEVLPAFEFEQDSVEQLVDSGAVTLKDTDFGYELSNRYADKGKSLKLSFKATGAEESFKGIRFDLPIYCRDLSLKEGVCFYVRTPEITQRPRYVEFKLQFDMPSRAQAVAGQTVYMTEKGGKTTESQVRDGNVIRVNSKFEGYVWIPFYAFQSTGGATLRRDQFMRMYLYADCEYFSGRELWLDSIGFYQKSDMPEVTEEQPPLPTLPDADWEEESGSTDWNEEQTPGEETVSSEKKPSEESTSSEEPADESESSAGETSSQPAGDKQTGKDGKNHSAGLWIVLGSVAATAVIAGIIVLLLLNRKRKREPEE